MSDFGASLRFYRDQLGLTEEARYDDPPYVTLTAAGARISLAEQGHPAPYRPGVAMASGVTGWARPGAPRDVMVVTTCTKECARCHNHTSAMAPLSPAKGACETRATSDAPDRASQPMNVPLYPEEAAEVTFIGLGMGLRGQAGAGGDGRR